MSNTVKKKFLIIADIVIALLLLAFDQFTKYLSVVHLKGKQAFVLIEGVLELDYLENRGAAFGMMQGQRWFLLLISIILVFVIGFLLFKIPTHKKYIWLHLVCAAIIAGGIGNMLDRFRLGYVIDFISFILINYPIFNVADCYVVVAAIGLCILLLLVYKEEDLEFLSLRRKTILQQAKEQNKPESEKKERE